MTGSLVPDPGSEGFGHRAAQNRCRRYLDALVVGQPDSVQPNHIAVAALARADEPRQQLDSRDFHQSLITIAQRAGDTRRIETGACRFGKGARFWPEWRPWSRQRDICDRASSFFRCRALVLRSF